MNQQSRTSEKPRVLLYGDVDLNVLDGSAVWLTSMAEAWAAAGVSVDVQLKASENRDLLSGVLRNLPGVAVLPARVRAGHQTMSCAEAADVLEELDERAPYDVVFVRGIHMCAELAERDAFTGRLWSYVTEFSYPAESMDAERRATLGGIAEASRLVLAQTPQARAVLEATIPAAAGRTVELTPMIPDALGRAGGPGGVEGSHEHADGVAGDSSINLVYTGKFARDWRTDLMPEIVDELRALGHDARLTMVGDKVQRSAEEPEWPHRMREVMETPRTGVDWAGAHDRAGATALTRAADISLGWRSPALDLSVELSTKVLESCALGVPPLLNRTSLHEELLGADYPLFVDAVHDTPADIARTIVAARSQLAELSERVRGLAAPYRIAARADVLRGYLDRVLPDVAPQPPGSSGGRLPRRVLVAGHDLKFAGELIDLLTSHPDIEVRFDRWTSLHHHDESASRSLLEWADVVMCEWAGPNAVWYARHKSDGQRLVVRMHMFELRGRWLEDLDTTRVDQFVAVSQLYKELLMEQLEVPSEQVTVVPNAVSVADLARTKSEGAEFRLGLVGIVPLRKRLDRAFDTLRLLRERDDRYTLHIRGKLPWEYPHEWRKTEQREAYLDWFARLGRSDIAGAVAFEPFGADMGNWLSKIGWVLSPSTTESFHLAPAEGMASGGLPVLWERPGVEGIFGSDFVVPDTAAAADFILRTDSDPTRRAELVERARRVADGFDELSVNRLWLGLLLQR
ncbi:glycosyltransferase [Zhihengliuella salsuginis]|uniref:Glycosyl transferase n=1 Tax=Zhihengliuella salsuginis TaxID=578222 RepID=A0ABQ3GLJ0_9MICC|nr:glycosyltransferase [Zhihengliuella salsuginis]GHD11759.1 glycosyl transferase [Zhihengliuella salsuginis]